MRAFTEFTGKSPEELILEVEQEVRSGKLMRERKIISYIRDFREFLENQNVAPKRGLINREEPSQL